MKVAYALTALSLLGVAIALPTPVDTREAHGSESTVEAKRDAQPAPAEEATNYFYAVQKKDAVPEEASNIFYAVQKKDAAPEEATNFFYAVQKRDAVPEEASNIFYAVQKKDAEPEEAATNWFYAVQ
ncbi:hypothetical protein BCON_0064g00480 [Botryotinia convoluta]|uniref:Uncharacterized protein n=1 Tax=Botryotinia convoluta TaxID=54673 RepID=A0A4Z1I7M0_9HELO|nr:hypothetical protein BCON_0064g00480 [Botryotinia convoluta]